MELFLEKLNTDLNKNLIALEIIKSETKDNVDIGMKIDTDLISIKIENITATLEKYKKSIKEIEDQYFHDDDNQFVLSFDGDISMPFQQDNYISTYKSVLTSQIIKHKNINKKYNHDDKNIENKRKILNEIEGVDLQSNILNLPIISDIKSIPPAFYWYEGDKFHKKGIYICLCQGFYVKVAFPNVISGASKDHKLNSIKCKYTTIEECKQNKKKNSEIYGSEIRECFYVHKKECFNKVGSIFRCSIENFGNHQTLNDDLKRVQNFDIKHLLMYSLSDDLLAILWYQNKFKDGNNLVFANIGTF